MTKEIRVRVNEKTITVVGFTCKVFDRKLHPIGPIESLWDTVTRALLDLKYASSLVSLDSLAGKYGEGLWRHIPTCKTMIATAP